MIGQHAQSSAAVIVSNLSDTMSGSGGVYASGPPQQYAQEFVTGGQSVQMGNVIADLGSASGSYTAAARLVANNGGIPGATTLTSFTVPSISTSFSDLTFSPTSSVLLSANTDYWFILSASGTGSYRWAYTDTNSTSLPNYANTHDGVTWQVHSNGPFLIEVDSASSVPEPASFVLVGFAGLLTLGVVLRHKLAAQSL